MSFDYDVEEVEVEEEYAVESAGIAAADAPERDAEQYEIRGP